MLLLAAVLLAAPLPLDVAVARMRPAVEAWTGPLPVKDLVVVPLDAGADQGESVPGVIALGSTDDAVVAHELAHQVFPGRRWDVEALCQELAALAVETRDGRNAAADVRGGWVATWEAYLRSGGHAGRVDRRVFASEPERVAHVFARAPQFYEAVRLVVGDDAFRAALRHLHVSDESLPDSLESALPGHAQQIEMLALKFGLSGEPEVPLAPPPYALDGPKRRCGCNAGGPGVMLFLLSCARRRRRTRRELRSP
jgi:hypothetical protein